MIIWSRYGFFVFLAIGAGVGTGAILHLIFDPTTESGPGFGLFMGIGLVGSAVYTWLLNRYLIAPRLDRPQPQFVLERLPQPVVLANGAQQTHRQIPVLHPETGQQIYVRPSSTFFFVPVRFWPFVLAALGVAILVGCAIALALA